MSKDPKLSEDDPRVQPDAYISLGTHLYEVIGLESTSASCKLHVRNCRTLHPLWLTAHEVTSAVLRRPAEPMPEGVPSDWRKAAA